MPELVQLQNNDKPVFLIFLSNLCQRAIVTNKFLSNLSLEAGSRLDIKENVGFDLLVVPRCQNISSGKLVVNMLPPQIVRKLRRKKRKITIQSLLQIVYTRGDYCSLHESANLVTFIVQTIDQ